MDRIAEVAGVSKRTVYNHFPSKEALFSMILEELWERSVASDALPYRADQPLQAQLLQLLGQKLELLSDANFIDLARVAMAEVIHSPERAQAIVCRMGEKESGEVRGSAQRSPMAGCEVDPEFAGHQLHGLVKSFAFWPQVTMGQAPLSAQERARVAESAVAMFLGFYAVAGGEAAELVGGSAAVQIAWPTSTPSARRCCSCAGFRSPRPPRSRRSGARLRR